MLIFRSHPMCVSAILLLSIGGGLTAAANAAAPPKPAPKPTPPGANVPKGAPAEAAVRKVLGEGEKEEPIYNYLTITKIHSVRYGTPRPGDWYKDGVPSGKKVTVYPVKVEMTIDRRNLHSRERVTSGEPARETRYASLWKNDFGEWTFRWTSGG